MIKEQAPPFTDPFSSSTFFNDSIFFQSDDYSSNSEDQFSISPSFNSFSLYQNRNSNINSVEDSNGSRKEEHKTDENKRIIRNYFTKKDDELLTAAALAYDQKSWNSIACCVPGKTPKQCRDRWVNYLQPSIQNAPWTNQEDQLLKSLVDMHGTHWSKMKSSFPNRSTNSIKNRWYWLIKNQAKSIQINRLMINNFNNRLKNQFYSQSVKNDFKEFQKNNSLEINHMKNYHYTFNNFNSELNTLFNYSSNQNNYSFLKKNNISEKNASYNLLSNKTLKQTIINNEIVKNSKNNIFINTETHNNQIETSDFIEFNLEEFL